MQLPAQNLNYFHLVFAYLIIIKRLAWSWHLLLQTFDYVFNQGHMIIFLSKFKGKYQAIQRINLLGLLAALTDYQVVVEHR